MKPEKIKSTKDVLNYFDELFEKPIAQLEKIAEDLKYKPPEKLDYSKIDNIVFEDIDHNDYPDFCDAFICSADYDGEPMTDRQLDQINDDRDFVIEKLFNYLY